MDDESLVAEGHRILYPAYGTDVGGDGGETLPASFNAPPE